MFLKTAITNLEERTRAIFGERSLVDLVVLTGMALVALILVLVVQGSEKEAMVEQTKSNKVVAEKISDLHAVLVDKDQGAVLPKEVLEGVKEFVAEEIRKHNDADMHPHAKRAFAELRIDIKEFRDETRAGYDKVHQAIEDNNGHDHVPTE